MQQCSAISCRSFARGIFSPMNCWTSSTTSRVHGSWPPKAEICWTTSSASSIVGELLSLEFDPEWPLGRRYGGILRLDCDERLGQRDRTVSARELQRAKVAILFFERGLDLCLQFRQAQPEDKLCLCKILWKAGGSWHGAG